MSELCNYCGSKNTVHCRSLIYDDLEEYFCNDCLRTFTVLDRSILCEELGASEKNYLEKDYQDNKFSGEI